MENYFQKLNDINVNEHTEQKNGLTYLSWAWAWGEVKKVHPDAFYTIYENKDGWFYHTDGRTCWVKTGVTVNDIEHIEYLPVMDFKNKSIPLEKVTSYDVNKAIQRSLTKACARHGLGLYIYAGEDLPEVQASIPFDESDARKGRKKQQEDDEPIVCSDCGAVLEGYTGKDGAQYSAREQERYTVNSFGRTLCLPCWKKAAASKSKDWGNSTHAYDSDLAT